MQWSQKYDTCFSNVVTYKYYVAENINTWEKYLRVVL